MEHDYYCVIRPRDPRQNPGHIPCPDAEKRNCEGCFIKDEADKETARKMKQKINGKAEYIEREIAIKAVKKEREYTGKYSFEEEHAWSVGFHQGISFALSDIASIPAADVAPVHHAKDIYYKGDGHCEFKCSLCGVEIGVVEGGELDGGYFRYCPGCGAKMNLEVGE